MKHRTIFISDIHLGTKGAKVEYLLDFLKHNDAETIYLIGDIFDLWRMEKSRYWPASHNLLIQKLLRKSRSGTKIFYIMGNHDGALREYCPLVLGDIEIESEQVHHYTADGKKLLIIHGDLFDGVVTKYKWLAKLGGHLYDHLLAFNTSYNEWRKFFGKDYWSLSGYLKHKAKSITKVIENFEIALVTAAEKEGCDGVVCGHIHKAEIRKVGDILYCNDGDWVESCTALVEDFDGNLKLIKWDYIYDNQKPTNDSNGRMASSNQRGCHDI